MTFQGEAILPLFYFAIMSGQFLDKGIIIKSQLSDTVKILLALYQNQDSGIGSKVPYVKILVKRLKPSYNGTRKRTTLYKNWITLKEVYAVIASLQRAAVAMEEYYEGTLALDKILTEDEDAANFIYRESAAQPTIDNMFLMEDSKEKEET